MATKWARLKEGQLGRLTTLQEFITKLAADQNQVPNLVDLEVRLEELDDIKLEYKMAQEKIIEKAKDDEVEALQDEFKKFHKDAAAIKSSLLQYSRLIMAQANSVDNHSNNGNSQPPNIQLPRLELPKFNGEYLLWTSFCDLFKSAIQNNSSLSDAQKLQYLKSSLSNEAAQLISSLQITSKNYTEAWKLLNQRYDNKRAIITAHMKKLFNQQQIKTESTILLRKLLDSTQQCIHSLKNLGLPTDEWDSMLVYLISDKLDTDSRRNWELSLTSGEYPKFSQLSSFIESRCHGLESVTSNTYTRSQAASSFNRAKQEPEKKSSRALHTTTANWNCVQCNEAHPLYKCSKFLEASVTERLATVKTYNLCKNCLRKNHIGSQCKLGPCKKCKSLHNSLLHPNEDTNSNTNNQSNANSSLTKPTSLSNFFVKDNSFNQVLLSTAMVNVLDSSGNLQPCTLLLDSGSQATFISKNCLHRLGIKSRYANANVNGLGSTESLKVKGKASFKILSRFNDFKHDISAFVLNKVTDKLPTYSFNSNNMKYLHNIQLADPHFNQKKDIDILLGADVYPFLNIHSIKQGPPGFPIAQNSKLGWILSGPIKMQQTSNHHIRVYHSTSDEELTKFWEIEEVPNQPILTNEEKQCEEHFQSTHYRESDGRYVVELPFKSNARKLGNSRDLALRRFLQVEKRLSKNPNLKQQYVDFMQEYENLNHMQIISKTDANISIEKSYFIPHHSVIKESSSTTKLRVVYDASAKTDSGYSLNENLIVGPTIQQDLVSILLRFRTHAIAYTADITKMYRQIKVNPKHTDFQRILWRQDSSLPINEYRLLTVTYGTAPASFLATRALKQLAIDEEKSFPIASQITMRDFYMDDLMSGSNSIKDALDAQQQLLQLMMSGGLELRKWISNCPQLLEAVSPELREIQLPLTIDKDDSAKTLGLVWHPAGDFFTFNVNLPVLNAYTKRTLLSDVAKLFDPLGWLSPVIIQAKVLFQDLWKLKLDWDTELPQQVLEKWLTLRSQLPLLQQLKIQRHIGTYNTSFSTMQLHGFCDSSESSYGAAIYILNNNESGETTVHLICSKTKVAPIKQQSIPRLELCGAVLLTKLMKSVIEALSFNSSVHLWTDSTIVLAWLSSIPTKWKTFVANRVALIQELLPNAQWLHVRSGDNPADMCSRGIPPSQLLDSSLWWHGPQWLSISDRVWRNPQEPSATEVLEEKHSSYLATTIDECWLPITKFSSFTKLTNTTAYILRFIFNLKNPSSKKTGPIAYIETQNAQQQLLKEAQKFHFKEELNQLQNNKQINKFSNIRKLSPFIGDSGLLLVGGRLRNSSLSYSQKHPALLPKRSNLTHLIIHYEHIRNLHAGPNLLLSILQQKYWLINGLSTIRQTLSQCIICKRQRAKTTEQLMADLPRYRIEPSRPFLNTGCDFAGPYILRQGLRGNKHVKGYIAIFICMVVKAIHIELVSSLSTEAFIAALKRFISRRGKCNQIFCDQGTNFVGAQRELSSLFKIASSIQVSEFSTQEGITWKFNPPASPHFGGLWEAGVKSIKYHLRRIVGNTPLSFEEMTTTLNQVEAVLNSRPLTPISNDPNDLRVLTPAHFLIGAPLILIPEPDLTSLKINRLSRWQLTQRLVQQFWKQWQREYLSRLQQRPKWLKKNPNLSINDLVLLKEDNQPPAKWKLGRIIQVHPGSDGIVRVATIKTSTGTIQRPVVKICPLISDTDMDVNSETDNF